MPGTVSPKDDFDVEKACKRLMKAMKGLGTDEKKIVSVLASHDNNQRQLIKAHYKEAYGKKLEKELKSEVGGDLGEAFQCLLMRQLSFQVHVLNKAMKGLGTDEKALIDILVGRDYNELELLKVHYKTKYNHELDDDLKGDLSGGFGKLMRGIVAASGEAAGPIDKDRAKEDAEALEKAAKGRGTDEDVFISIFNTRSYPQLVATFLAYYNMTGEPIYTTIKKEFSGDLKNGLIAIIQKMIDPVAYFADRLHESVKGFGTDELTLIRIIVGRSEIDLEEIRQSFLERHANYLTTVLQKELSGNLKRLLVKIVNEV